MKKPIVLILLTASLAFVTVACQSKGAANDSATTAPAAASTTAPTNAYINPAVASGGVQTVTTKFSSRGYAPITVQVGIPVEWTIQMEPKDLNGCNYAMSISKFGITRKLAAGETLVTFTPLETGTIPYSCWMGMIRSSITVVDDLISPDAGETEEADETEETIQETYNDVHALSVPFGEEIFEGGGCCGF